ncbi:MAG TPA: hypothetical protein VE913_21560 [Longimicrobium sp.]|nr:hypothetical protein [Longimicrobium sp.]
MSTMEQDLWPKDIEDVDVIAPVAIMKRQASRLANHTRRLVTADVVSTGSADRFDHMFYVRARTLRYENLLFTVTHSVEMYPLTVLFDGLPQGKGVAETEEQFVTVLATVLQHPDTQRLIKTLMAQIEV